jgi:DNA-binding transcriptional LysR family regulator
LLHEGRTYTAASRDHCLTIWTSYAEAARLGLGIAQAPRYRFIPDPEGGRLVELLTDWRIDRWSGRAIWRQISPSRSRREALSAHSQLLRRLLHEFIRIGLGQIDLGFRHLGR